MAKLKKSEAFTIEREKEIPQVSKSWIYALLLMTCLTLCGVIDGLRTSSFAFIGCGICERACSDYEGFISTSHRPGQQIPSFEEVYNFLYSTLF